MTRTEPAPGVRFGRTVITALTGDLLDQPVEGIVVAANVRGVLGAALGGALRTAGGSEIEREAMAQAPFELGSVAITGAHGLAPRGVRMIVHAAIHPTLGAPARIDDVRRAVRAALRAAELRRVGSLAFPLLGVELGLGVGAVSEPVVDALVDELVACLRRSPGRLDQVILVSRFPDQCDLVAAVVARARVRSWVRSA